VCVYTRVRKTKRNIHSNTITQAAAVDLFHFVVLFTSVFISYACVGTILFGHQMESMSSVQQASLTLVVMLISFDTTQFYAGVRHTHTHTHTYIHTYMRIHIHVLAMLITFDTTQFYAGLHHTHIQTNMSTYMHACAHTYIHVLAMLITFDTTQFYAGAHTNLHTCARTCARTL
jgi:hypothetical protein